MFGLVDEAATGVREAPQEVQKEDAEFLAPHEVQNSLMVSPFLAVCSE